MKPHLYLLMLFTLLTSCSVKRPVPGSYHSNGAAYIKSIKLEKNGSFLLSIDNYGRQAGFLGNWKYLSRDTVLLMYNTEDFPGVLVSEHIADKQEKLILLNNSEIKYNQFVLSKVKMENATAKVNKRWQR